MEYLLVYLALINVISIIVCVKDKFKSQTHGRRTRERNLFVLSILGGSIGMYITMQLIRHKTNHKRFILGVPVIILIQIVILMYLMNTYY